MGKRRDRVDFTQSEDEALARYIYRQGPSRVNSDAYYDELAEKVDTHPAASWRNRYRNKREQIDRLIKKMKRKRERDRQRIEPEEETEERPKKKKKRHASSEQEALKSKPDTLKMRHIKREPVVTDSSNDETKRKEKLPKKRKAKETETETTHESEERDRAKKQTFERGEDHNPEGKTEEEKETTCKFGARSP
ncbi:hypothetical protein BT69DRAFT_483797 [Atractiella rhizophila]|nr:hypothetical protein BT69DRAFT_483797 [Atractiella rhizophila]